MAFALGYVGGLIEQSGEDAATTPMTVPTVPTSPESTDPSAQEAEAAGEAPARDQPPPDDSATVPSIVTTPEERPANDPTGVTLTCDVDAVTTALADGPQGYQLLDEPTCSESFAVLRIGPTGSTGGAAELVVVMKRPADTWETAAVVLPSECPALVASEPQFPPAMCPA